MVMTRNVGHGCTEHKHPRDRDGCRPLGRPVRSAMIRVPKKTVWPAGTLLSVALTLPLTSGCGSEGVAPRSSTLIQGALVVDGTGAAGRQVSVRVRDGRIEAIGALEAEDVDIVIDAQGLVLAPGFIDTHSHHDRGLLEQPEALAAVSQGITTIVVGQDGGSQVPLGDWFASLEASPVAVNVASYVGHNTLRNLVLADDPLRAATAGEIAEMRGLIAADMDAGSLGLSTGLEYDPGLYASTEEVIELAREAAEHGGRYISHMRSEDQFLFDAIEEALRVGREAHLPVQISHLKLAMKGLWGGTPEVLEMLDQARAEGIDVTADVYPYEYWQSTMTVIFPERDFEDRDAFEFALDQVVPPEGLLLAEYEPHPAYEGMTLAEVAEQRGEDPVDSYMHLVQESQALAAELGRGTESVIATSMHPVDVASLLLWPHSNVSSDGASAGGHPRGFGAFPRVLARLVRDQKLLSLEAAIHKMTGLSAEHMGIAGRGKIVEGAAADLVLLDPAAVQDRATPASPHLTAEGIRRVWVNGEPVFTQGEVTGATPGVVLRRGS